MPLYNNILSSSRRLDQKETKTNEATKNNPSASMKLLQDHLMSKRRAQQQNASKQLNRSQDNKKKTQVVLERDLHKNLGSELWDLDDDYDPRVPNSYEILRAELIRAAEEQRAAIKVTSSSKKININLLNALDELENEASDSQQDNKPSRTSTAIAPPPSLVASSTKVILLQNMVGPGEVDDNLEAETKEECKKYGDVVKCLIYEIPNKTVPDEEAVRIFVEFRRVESAMKAISDLNGRFFAGRVVRATFYDMDRFYKYDLGPPK